MALVSGSEKRVSSSTETTFGRRSVVADVVTSTPINRSLSSRLNDPVLLKLSPEREVVDVVVVVVGSVVVVVDDDDSVFVVIVVVVVFSGGTTLRTAPILTIFGVMNAAAGFELDKTGFVLDRSGFVLDKTGFGLDATCNSAARFRRDKKMSAIGILEKKFILFFIDDGTTD